MHNRVTDFEKRNLFVACSWNFPSNNEIKSLQSLFGYTEFKSPRVLVSKVGYSNPMVTVIPEDITVKVLESAKSKAIVIFGTDCSRVGMFAARVRSLKSPERYKGKGILYADEVINLKEGKRK